jgi:hypothetical protein
MQLSDNYDDFIQKLDRVKPRSQLRRRRQTRRQTKYNAA